MATTEKLIELVKKYPILYDLGHEEHKNIRKRDKIWDGIAVELNDTGDEVKKKWKNVRDTFVRYIRLNKTRTGQAAKNTKKWQCAEHMEMFRPFLTFAKTSSNVSELVVTHEPTTTFDTDDGKNTEDVENEENKSRLNQAEVSDTDKVTHSVSKSTASNSVLKADIITKSRKRSRDPASMKSASSVDAIVNYFENKRKPKHDATDLLFLSYSNSIKNFSGKRQAETKLQIAQIIAQQEILHYEEQSLLNSGSQSYQMSRPSTSCSCASESSCCTSSPLISPISGSEPRIPNANSTDYEETLDPEQPSAANYVTLFNPYTPHL